jgi:acetyl-CoA synthetase
VIDRYDELHQGFRWRVPERFNIAEACCGRWARATPAATAVHHEHENGGAVRRSYAELQADADRLAHALQRLGVARGDRVAVVMPQRFETAVAHIAIYQLGAVAMPLSMLFGPDALEYRLNDSQARVAIVDESAIDNLLAARPACAQLQAVIAVGGSSGRGDVDWVAALADSPGGLVPLV